MNEKIFVTRFYNPAFSILLFFGTIFLFVGAGYSKATETTGELVNRMLQDIRQDAAATSNYTGLDALAERVLDAIKAVPREEFVPSASLSAAYLNQPLRIGYGQTISQPFIVALMTQLLDVSSGDRILEIGTGSGYQAAVLAELGAEVYTVEIIPELAASAAERLDTLGYEQINVRSGDGNQGWQEAAPFDSIIVTAVGDHIPPQLLAQLKPGGIMVMPLGQSDGFQQLTVVQKPMNSDAQLEQRSVLPVRFVPLTGDTDGI